ncbi:hypothetical protein HZA97_00085 [Candidatus Woesearchaeota archaeon]|nr:hypothetical protein [Candidatus Woesearchaeota archaeon]
MTLPCYSGVNFEKYDELLGKNNLKNYRRRLKEIIMGFKDLKTLKSKC